MFIAPNLDAFKHRFSNGLSNMLASGGLGAFILVLANSMQDEGLFALLGEELHQQFEKLKRDKVSGPPDDEAVFTALAETGIAGIPAWRYHSHDVWEIVLNPLRSLRPARVSQEVFTTLHTPFDPARFHFNKPFLRPEILWEGEWDGSSMRVLYNKFPFAPWHLLVVPEPEKTLPQWLTREHHARMQQLVSSQAGHLPGFGLAYNSLGAYASINQLHFQGFIREKPLPVEHPRWTHNNGNEPYPLECLYFESAQDSWGIIDALHQENQPYNLLYRANGCYILPRKGQGLVELPAWAQGIAWHEACGVFTLPDVKTLENIGDISRQLGKLHRQAHKNS